MQFYCTIHPATYAITKKWGLSARFGKNENMLFNNTITLIIQAHKNFQIKTIINE